MADSQLKQVLEFVEQVSNRSSSVRIEYCVTDDEGVLNHVGSSLDPFCVTQAVPLRLVISELQLRLPAILTMEAFARGTNISAKPEIEYLLYLAGSRQIKQTLDKLSQCLSKPYVALTFCREGDEAFTRTLPKELNCSPLDFKDLVNPDLNLVKKFYGLTGDAPDELLKDVLTMMNHLKLR